MLLITTISVCGADGRSIGLVTSIFALGGLCGALTAQPLGNRFGRRSTLALNSLGFIVAGVMKALATNVPVLTFGRFVSGLSSGAAAVVVPLYVNEIAPSDAKGKLYCPPPPFRWWTLGLTGCVVGPSRRYPSTLASSPRSFSAYSSVRLSLYSCCYCYFCCHCRSVTHSPGRQTAVLAVDPSRRRRRRRPAGCLAAGHPRVAQVPGVGRQP